MFLYIDATAGGVLIQVLLGGFAGIGVVGRLVWGRFFGRGEDSGIESDWADGGRADDETEDIAA